MDLDSFIGRTSELAALTEAFACGARLVSVVGMGGVGKTRLGSEFVARYVTAYLSQEKFLQRPVEERRAIYAVIASTASDEVVPELEHELNGGNWFDRDQEVHRHAVARCLVRIGTPRAFAALEAGAQSRRAPVRQACAAALQTRAAA